MFNPIIALRSEIVCLVLLIFLFLTAKKYNMGKDKKTFELLIVLAIIHLVFDAITVIAVNSEILRNQYKIINDIIHITFYYTAILYSKTIWEYVFFELYPEKRRLGKLIGWILPFLYGIFLIIASVITQGDVIRYVDTGQGTWSSDYLGAYVGYITATIYFIAALVLIIINHKKFSSAFSTVLIPLMFILIIAEGIQAFYKPFLFTGGAITIVTVGFFFSLENPVEVFKKKLLTDALTGMGSRHSYEEDLAIREKEFAANPNNDFMIAFCDINKLRDVNNRYGHSEGDKYISLVATELLNKIKLATNIYRIGGDEFLIAYYKVDVEQAVDELNSLQGALAIKNESSPYHIGVSIGYAVSSNQYSSLSDVIKAADFSMYQNKAKYHANKNFGGGVNGIKANTEGLTNSFFEAMCQLEPNYYFFVCNLRTNTARLSTNWKDDFDLGDEFIVNFDKTWLRKIIPQDRKKYMDDITGVISGQKERHDCVYKALNKDHEYVKCHCQGYILHDEEEELDLFIGYMYDIDKEKNKNVGD